jgi:NADPH:quinone reductase-like Zn-dependent oxidoreductase
MRRGKYYDQPAFPFVPGYDLVGIDEQTGARVAALTKVGGWADRVILEQADLVPVPEGVSAEAAETVIVNGVTAWRMLHRTAKAKAGQTIVVHGAAGGVGTVLVQLARHANINVIGTAGPKQQQRLRDLGVTPIDYRSEDVSARVRELAPDGVAAVFDHVGGPQINASWRMLARGGALVSYGTASTKDVAGNPQVPVLKLLAKLTVWNLLPNGKSASFFNLWAGRRFRKDHFRAQLREDLGHVLELVRDGAVTPQIAARFGLEQAAEALRFAEAGGNTGKVLILP